MLNKLWPRRRSKVSPISLSGPKKPAWAVFFWLAQFRRWLRYLWRDFVAVVMRAIMRSVYRVDMRGLKHFSYKPSTIVACSHKRDEDIPLFIGQFYTFRGRKARKALRLVYTATRDDLHENGFLILYFPALDRWLRPVLARLRVSRFIRQLQSCPVKLPDEQTVSQLLQETKRLEGNLPLAETVTPEWQMRLLGEKSFECKDLTIWDALLKAPLPVLAQLATPRMFKEPLSSRIIKRHHQTVIEQLRHMSRVLDKGGVLFIAPEGQVTPDGHFGKPRAALTRVVQQTRADLKMTPINMTYDFMDSEKTLAIINVGPEITGLKNYAKNELVELVRRSVAGLACVTMSGLAGRWLIEAVEKGQGGVNYRRFSDELWHEAQHLQALGLLVERHLENWQDFEIRLKRFLNYAFASGKIFKPQSLDLQTLNGDSWLEFDLPALARQECRKFDDHPARYCYNELMSLLEAHNLLGARAEGESESAGVYDLAAARARRLTAG